MIRHFDYVASIDGPQSFTAPGRKRILCKGGGGDGYYEGAEKLYQKQAETADFMLGMGKQYLPGATEGYYAASKNYFDPGYAARMAGEAGTTAQRSIDQNRATMTRDMARYGINPASGKWASMNNASAMQGAALKAGSTNAALLGVEDKKLGVAKDFYSALVGMPSDAAATAGSAANGFASLGMQADQQQSNQNAAYGNIAALGYETMFAADGGEVKATRKDPLSKVAQDVWDAGERYYKMRKEKGARPDPKLVGDGMARSAADGIRAHRARVDEAASFADGGEVAGRYYQEDGVVKYEDPNGLDRSPHIRRFLKWVPRQYIDGPPAGAATAAAAPARQPVAGNIWAQDFDARQMAPTDGSRRLVQDSAPVRMAQGGLLSMPAPPPIPSAPQPQQQSVSPLRSGIKTAKLMKDGPSAAMDKMAASGGRGMERLGNLIGNEQLAAEGIGKQAAANSTDLGPAIEAYRKAGMDDVASGLAKGAGAKAVESAAEASIAALGEQGTMLAAQNAGIEGAATMTAEALGTSVATQGATGLAGGLGLAATAIPWLGAAYAVGSMFDLFNEGGEVEDGRQDYTPGGNVAGPGDGTTTSDLVPAWLTDGEFVVDVEATRMPGVKKALKTINDAGLAVRQKGVRA